MDEAQEQHLDRTFFALSDRTRRQMLDRLAAGEASVSELASPHPMSLPAVLKHLAVLRAAGLITEEKSGRVRRCRLDPASLATANAWIAHYQAFWSTQLEALESFVATLNAEQREAKAPAPKATAPAPTARPRRPRRR